MWCVAPSPGNQSSPYNIGISTANITHTIDLFSVYFSEVHFENPHLHNATIHNLHAVRP